MQGVLFSYSRELEICWGRVRADLILKNRGYARFAGRSACHPCNRKVEDLDRNGCIACQCTSPASAKPLYNSPYKYNVP